MSYVLCLSILGRLSTTKLGTGPDKGRIQLFLQWLLRCQNNQVALSLITLLPTPVDTEKCDEFRTKYEYCIGYHIMWKILKRDKNSGMCNQSCK